MEDTAQKRNKRKRKKTFLQNARKYAKKGYYGRGTKLSEDSYQYFVRIMEAYKEGFPSGEEKCMFVNNVFDQTIDEEINIACNQVGCRVIETLLPFANNEVLERYMTKLGDELRPLCSDRFASHVIEALLKESSSRSLKQDEEFMEKYKEFTIKVSRFLLNNLEDYMWDTYGNHTLRSVLCYLSGIPRVEENKKHSSTEESTSDTLIPDYYKDIINDYGTRLITWPQFKELPFSDLTSGFLQILLKVLAKTNKDTLKLYIKKLLGECFVSEQETESNDNLPAVFMSKPNMMLLETVLQVATTKLYTKIYTKCFCNHLVKLSTARSTNFAVQRLFNYCQQKTEFDSMFDEIENNFKDILEAGHSGLLLATAEACKRLSTKQGSFVQSLMKALDCFEPVERQETFVLCVSKLTPYQSTMDNKANLEKQKLNLHGTLMVQVMLTYNKPIKLVNSILNMDQTDAKGLFCNTMGSHIVDSFVKSEFIGEKSREKLVRKMQGTYQELASTKFGSRSFEAIWNAANMKMKMYILDEMMYKEALWSNTDFGKIISCKINFQLYKQNKEEWKNAINKTVKASLVDEILNN